MRQLQVESLSVGFLTANSARRLWRLTGYGLTISEVFTIHSKMNCTTRNVIYAIFCQRCNKSYIGETVNLRSRANSHRNNIKNPDYAVMQVSKHIYNCGQGFRICPILKLNEECKISRLVKEDRLIKSLKPDLNADQQSLLHLNLW